jgi:hypothetical protein
LSKNQNGKTLTALIIDPIAITADDAANGDIYRIATLSLDVTLVAIDLFCTTLTSAVNNDLGLFKASGGVAADDDLLMDGQTFAAASRALSGLKDVSVANSGLSLRDLYTAVNASGTSFDGETYCDIGLSIKTASTADGFIGGVIYYLA